MRKHRHVALIVIALTAATVGCRYRLPALKPPKFDPEATAVAALEQYDTDSDGRISGGELKAAPSISFALDRIDSDGDDEVTTVELARMIQEKWIDAGGGVIRVKAVVTLNRRELDGATITFEPEDFLGNVIHAATGVTDANGFAAMSMAPEHMPHKNVRSGVAPGLYLVRISKMVDDRELIPAKYNTETTLGVEVAMRASYMPGHVQFDLTK